MKIYSFSQKVKIIAIFLWIGVVSAQLYLPIHFFGKDLFDRVIYRKSPWHGYNPKSGLCPFWVNSDGYRDIEFYRKKPGEYLILVVGDSIVYGQGLLTSQRFSNKLEKMLNRIKPTRVFNLGECGTNIYRHYLIAERFREKLNPDLVVMTFYNNDLLVGDEKHDFPQEINSNLRRYLLRDFFNDPSKTGEEYYGRVLGTFDESTDNWQMLTYLLPRLQKEKAVYFFVTYDEAKEFKEKILDTYELFRSSGLNAIHPRELLKSEKYRKISSFNISERELHPNALANQIFADRLYEEIITNPVYGFNTQ